MEALIISITIAGFVMVYLGWAAGCKAIKRGRKEPWWVDPVGITGLVLMAPGTATIIGYFTGGF